MREAAFPPFRNNSLYQSFQASSCQPCAAGHFSEAFADEGGKTHRCLQCSPGYSQAQSSSTACEPCDKGSLADQPGSIECQPCGVGFYQNLSAQTSCIPCSEERTTQLLGANQLDACVCKANYIEDELKMCRPCGEGLFCPLGSTLKGLMGNDGSIPETSPAVKEGYRSNKDTPKSIYKCVDMQCPGGQPGSCSGGHQGITCAKCEPKHYSWAGGECQRCGVGAEVAWPIVCIVVVSLGLVKRSCPKSHDVFLLLSFVGCRSWFTKFFEVHLKVVTWH